MDGLLMVLGVLEVKERLTKLTDSIIILYAVVMNEIESDLQLNLVVFIFMFRKVRILEYFSLLIFYCHDSITIAICYIYHNNYYARLHCVYITN